MLMFAFKFNFKSFIAEDFIDKHNFMLPHTIYDSGCFILLLDDNLFK